MSLGDAAFSKGDYMRRLAALEREVQQLRSARRLESATIGEGGLTVKGAGGITMKSGGDILVEDGGDIRILDGGELHVIHPDGNPLLHVRKSFGTGAYEIAIRREANEPAFAIQTQPDGTQYWSLWDRSGRLIVSDDANSGHGLARPWLPVPLAMKFVPDTAQGTPYSYAVIDSGQITAQTQLWEGRVSISHPKITVDGVWGRGSGNVNTTYRLKVNGTTIGSWNETGLSVGQRGPFDTTDLVGTDWATIEITCVATSGSGAVACQVLSSYLRQS